VDYGINQAYQRKVWQYKDADLDKLNLLIESFDWGELFENTSSVESAAELFSTQYLTLVRECIPEKTITIRPKDKPWFDSILRKYIRIRNRLRKKALLSNVDTDWSKYRKVRNKVNNLKKHALKNYYDNIDVYINDASKDNNKLYWKLMKDVFQTKPSREIPPIRHTADNGDIKYIFSDIEKIKALNEYFSSISNVDESGTNLPDNYLLCEETLSDIVIQEHEIYDIISILPVNKAVGPDCISHKMLKSTAKAVSKPLCILFNKSLCENTFPNYWKMAHVLPLFKKDDPSIKSNYRPVSLLSCVSKIMERVVFKYVYNFFSQE
jgi:hypothetical protein